VSVKIDKNNKGRQKDERRGNIIGPCRFLGRADRPIPLEGY